ncbi:hypothetical protein AB996_1604 [Lactococcus cremoris]|uniref:Uncharacterized protein n=1 Tax=Lactococcus lactis subsp. cremoris TaxID=1359 RepID=A0A166JC43_LACLC|nr:hypothetical protein AB996_1604 [Lactococcus cremoris]
MRLTVYIRRKLENVGEERSSLETVVYFPRIWEIELNFFYQFLGSVYGRLSQVLTRSLATYTSSPESPK